MPKHTVDRRDGKRHVGGGSGKRVPTKTAKPALLKTIKASKVDFEDGEMELLLPAASNTAEI